MQKIKKNIAITMGDANGISPEIIVKSIAKLQKKIDANLIIFGNLSIIQKAVEMFVPDFQVKQIYNLSAARNHKYLSDKILCFQPEIENIKGFTFDKLAPGKLSIDAGLCAYDLICCATKKAIEKEVDAIVTAPINKATINLAGKKDFCGHTELIAEISGVKDFVMQQSAENLRVVFVTTHIALAKVLENISVERMVKTTLLLYDNILQEGIINPKIAIAGINPHAGENGFMGDEDVKISEVAVNILKNKGLDVSGPYPSDTLFIEKVRTRFDGIVCAYHDQGHIPFKMLAFDKGVNSTLGLPIIRTSPDHGTAFEIAWQNRANIGSISAAIILAYKKILNTK